MLDEIVSQGCFMKKNGIRQKLKNIEDYERYTQREKSSTFYCCRGIISLE